MGNVLGISAVMEFDVGRFKTYRATKLFALGDGSMVLHRDDTVLFDGLDVKLGANTVEFPQLRAAIRSGWLVEVTP